MSDRYKSVSELREERERASELWHHPRVLTRWAADDRVNAIDRELHRREEERREEERQEELRERRQKEEARLQRERKERERQEYEQREEEQRRREEEDATALSVAELEKRPRP